ncbi:MAG: hypothetical protein JW940_25930 [Polyangiaceae bacterium]|nr:hypothetical protein [Polyangiaceae bacterium]
MRHAHRRTSRVLVPNPERVRVIRDAAGFGWLDARLWRDGWLEVLSAEDLSVYTFLCLVADRQGVSWYRQDRIRAALGLEERAVWHALSRLEALGLVAYRPFHVHASEGFRQVLAMPSGGPSLVGLVGAGDAP